MTTFRSVERLHYSQCLFVSKLARLDRIWSFSGIVNQVPRHLFSERRSKKPPFIHGNVEEPAGLRQVPVNGRKSNLPQVLYCSRQSCDLILRQLLFIDLSYIDVSKEGNQIIEAGVCWDNASNAFYFCLLIVVNSSHIDVVFGILSKLPECYLTGNELCWSMLQ